MLDNLVLSLRLIWTAGLGISLLAGMARRPKTGGLLGWGAVLALPLGLYLDSYRWRLGGREVLEGLLSPAVLILMLLVSWEWSKELDREFRPQRPRVQFHRQSSWSPSDSFKPIMWLFLVLLLPQPAIWDLARWPFTILAPVGGLGFLNGKLLGEVFGIVLGAVLAGAGLVTLALLIRSLPPELARTAGLAGLVVYAARHLVVLGQVLVAREIWAPGPLLFRGLVQAINLLPFFSEVLLVLGLGWAILALAITRRSRNLDFSPALNPAQRRKLLAGRLHQQRLAWLAGICLAGTLSLLTWQHALAGKTPELTPAQPVTAIQDGKVLLKLAELLDGQLHRYSFTTVDGTPVRFIALNKGGSLFGTGLDYCDYCGTTGYIQRGNQVICLNCDVAINRVTVGFPGGCNPLPLTSKVEGDYLVIEAAELEEQREKFAGD